MHESPGQFAEVEREDGEFCGAAKVLSCRQNSDRSLSPTSTQAPDHVTSGLLDPTLASLHWNGPEQHASTFSYL